MKLVAFRGTLDVLSVGVACWLCVWGEEGICPCLPLRSTLKVVVREQVFKADPGDRDPQLCLTKGFPELHIH